MSRLLSVTAETRESLELLREKYTELDGDPRVLITHCDDYQKRYVLRTVKIKKLLDAVRDLKDDHKFCVRLIG